MKATPETLIALCEGFAMHGSWNKALIVAGIRSRNTLHRWLASSRMGDQTFVFYWEGDGIEAALHVHLDAARQLNILALEGSIRSMAIEGWSQPKYFQGQPVWCVDPEIASDAMTLDDDTWQLIYGDRKRSDTYARDERGALVQACDVVKPSPELQVKILEQLKTYRTPKDVNVNISGGGLLRLDRPGEEQIKQIEHAPQPFVGEIDQEPEREATNVLALGRPAESSEEFDRWAKEGEFDPATPVDFVLLDGKRVTQGGDPPQEPPRYLTMKERGELDAKVGAKPYISPDAKAEGIGRGGPSEHGPKGFKVG